ncbi:MAG: SpoIIE family protein phosphatase [Planctomycetota bacterium]|nr:SpoIIE family protein phosphatase [Planctomycetota bacterium]
MSGDRKTAFGGDLLGMIESNFHPVMYYRRLCDEAGTFLFVGGWAYEVTGYKRARLDGRNGSLAELIHPEDRERAFRAIRKGVEGNRLLRVDYRLVRADGQERQVIDRTRAFWNEEGEVEFYEGVITDPVTCDEEVEKARFDEERVRAMMEASFEGIVLHDKGVFLDGNPAISRMLGYDREELCGMKILDVIDPADHEMVMDRVRSGYSKPYQLLGVRKDGSRFHAEVRGKDIVYQGRPVRVVAVRDITMFMKAEETLKQANEQLEARVAERTHQLEERQSELNRMNQGLLRELATARRVQESLLPGRSFSRPGISVAAHYLPALEVGGDAYNLIQLGDGRVAALIADLTGHGIQAALSTVLVTSTFSGHAGQNVTPHEILAHMNAALRTGLPAGTYAAALVLTLDPQTGACQILNAGIPDPLLIRRVKPTVDVVSCRGPLLGVLSDDEYASFQAQTFELSPNETLLLFTDGIDEVRNPGGEFFGRVRLRELLLDTQALPNDELPDRLVSEARGFSGPMHAWDDITILSILRT